MKKLASKSSARAIIFATAFPTSLYSQTKQKKNKIGREH